jgi:hypothetical protein
MRRGDWMRFHCGDRVYDVEDPVRAGRIEMLTRGMAIVCWDKTNWLSEVELGNLRREI